MARTMKTLSVDEVKEITKVFRGELPGVSNPSTAAVARRFDITESDASALRTAVTTAVPGRTVTETAPDLTAAATGVDADASRKASLAFKLHTQVNEAEARVEADDGSMAGLSIQHLEALAAAAAADAGMFG